MRRLSDSPQDLLISLLSLLQIPPQILFSVFGFPSIAADKSARKSETIVAYPGQRPSIVAASTRT
jgi:hypothetical protein